MNKSALCVPLSPGGSPALGDPGQHGPGEQSPGGLPSQAAALPQEQGQR